MMHLTQHWSSYSSQLLQLQQFLQQRLFVSDSSKQEDRCWQLVTRTCLRLMGSLIEFLLMTNFSSVWGFSRGQEWSKCWMCSGDEFCCCWRSSGALSLGWGGVGWGGVGVQCQGWGMVNASKNVTGTMQHSDMLFLGKNVGQSSLPNIKYSEHHVYFEISQYHTSGSTFSSSLSKQVAASSDYSDSRLGTLRLCCLCLCSPILPAFWQAVPERGPKG